MGHNKRDLKKEKEIIKKALEALREGQKHVADSNGLLVIQQVISILEEK
jgi:hypothetical protein